MKLGGRHTGATPNNEGAKNRTHQPVMMCQRFDIREGYSGKTEGRLSGDSTLTLVSGMPEKVMKVRILHLPQIIEATKVATKPKIRGTQKRHGGVSSVVAQIGGRI